MKRKLLALSAAFAALCLSVLMIAGCSSSSQESADNTAATAGTDAASTGVLIVGFDAGYPPYGFQAEDGSYTGVDIDLATEAASRLGWEVQLEPIDWDAKDALIDSGSINCLWNGFTMEGREDDYTFSEPYMLNEQVVVVRADSGIKGIEDLEGKIVATQVDSAALDVLEGDMKDVADTFKELQQLSDYNNAFMQMESGMVDAVACDLSIAQYQLAANPDTYVQLDRALSSEHYAVGFKKGDTDCAEQITKTLKEMYADGTVEKILNNYADYGVSIENWVLVD